MGLGNSAARKFFFQFILWPFPFCQGIKKRGLKNYNVYRIIQRNSFCFTTAEMTINFKNFKLKTVIYFEIPHKVYLPFFKSQFSSYGT